MSNNSYDKSNGLVGNEIYERLLRQLDEGSFIGFPSSPSHTELEILKHIFTEQEARLALKIGDMLPKTLEVIAQLSGESIETTERLLEHMIEMGSLFWMEQNGVKLYFLAPLAHGLIDHSGLRGSKELNELFEKYCQETYYPHFKNLPPEIIMRWIPVSTTVDSKKTVAPYDDAVAIIRSHEKIAIMNCACRSHNWMLFDKPADKPIEVCMAFDWFADYYVKSGYGRYITRDEALEIQKQCEEAGYINMPSQIKDSPILCHCDKYCHAIRAIKDSPRPAELHASNYFALVNDGACTGCGICIDRCQIDAINMSDDQIAVINYDRCIGCGQCAHVCPADAVYLEMKEEDEKPLEPMDPMEAAKIMAESKGKKPSILFHDAGNR